MDFSNENAYPPGQYDGIIVLRGRKGQTATTELAERAIDALGKLPLSGCLWIVEFTQIRVRRRRSE